MVNKTNTALRSLQTSGINKQIINIEYNVRVDKCIKKNIAVFDNGLIVCPIYLLRRPFRGDM